MGKVNQYLEQFFHRNTIPFHSVFLKWRRIRCPSIRQSPCDRGTLFLQLLPRDLPLQGGVAQMTPLSLHCSYGLETTMSKVNQYLTNFPKKNSIPLRLVFL